MKGENTCLRPNPAGIRSGNLFMSDQTEPARNMRSVFQATLIALCMPIALSGCKKSENGAAGGDVIKLGEYTCLTGATASFGTASHNGATLAVDAANKEDGVLGKRIKLIT